MSRDTRPARAAMQGNGFYNRNSSAQAEGISRVMALWERTASAVEVGDEALMVADYGSSQGRNSMTPVRVAIDALRAKAGPDRPVQVIHTDLSLQRLRLAVQGASRGRRQLPCRSEEHLSRRHRPVLFRTHHRSWAGSSRVEFLDAPLAEPQYDRSGRPRAGETELGRGRACRRGKASGRRLGAVPSCAVVGTADWRQASEPHHDQNGRK